MPDKKYMMPEILKKLFPWFIAILVFLTLTGIFFSPMLKGKVLLQTENIKEQGMTKELADHEKRSGEKSMWTNSMFSGMPAYQIRGDNSNNMFAYFNRIASLGLPYETMAIFFMYLLGFYILLISMRLDSWLSIVGATAFALGSYNLLIIVAGYISEGYAVALMAPVVAGVLYSYNKNKWAGGIFTTIALGMEIANNDIRTIYYLALIVMIIVTAKLIHAVKNKIVPEFTRVSGILAIAVVLALFPNISHLWSSYELGELSTKERSAVAVSAGEQSSESNYEKKEILTLLIPNVVGGASKPIARSDIAMAEVDSDIKEYVGQYAQYWGGSSYSSGPVYVGAIICFLFFLGAFYYKGKERWWLIIATFLSIFPVWGKSFVEAGDLMAETAFVISFVTITLLAFLGVNTILDKPEVIKQYPAGFYISLAFTAGVSLILALFPDSFFDFLTPLEKDLFAGRIAKGGDNAGVIGQLELNLTSARRALLTADAWRSFFFILLAAISTGLYLQNKISPRYLTWGLGILIFIDLWGIDIRYLNANSYISKNGAKQMFSKSKADIMIEQDRDLYFRIFSIYQDPFTDVKTSYFHKSIGGDSNIRLRRYQDVIDSYLEPYRQKLVNILKQPGAIPGDAEAELDNTLVLNMLNAKYVIYNPDERPIFNPNYMGNSWFVKRVKIVRGVEGALSALGGTDLHCEAVVEKEFAGKVEGYRVDSITGQILLNNYSPDNLIYTGTSTQKQLAVFSDIYYPKGWNAYIDGKPVEYIRVDYILRGLMIPAGEHTIVFKFEPDSVKYGQIISAVSSILILLLIILFVIMFWKRNRE